MHSNNRHLKGSSMTETYHYRESGLDSVYLVNGFELNDGRLKIHEIEGLHRAIGRWLLSARKILSGAEIRFLRHELELPQAAVALLLGVTERTVIRWENDRNSRNSSNPAAERALRLLYLEKALGAPKVSEALNRIANLEDQRDQCGEFSYSDDQGWHEDLAA